MAEKGIWCESRTDAQRYERTNTHQTLHHMWEVELVGNL